MIIIAKEYLNTIRISEPVTKVYRIADFTIQGDAIPKTIGAAEGNLLIFDGTNWQVLAPPSASDLNLVSDLTVDGLWKIGAAAGGGGGTIDLTNKDGSDSTTGSLVVADVDNDEAFKGTTTPHSLGVIGATTEDIVNNATGQVLIAGMVTLLVSGNVTRGEWMVSSATKWRAKTAGYDRPQWGSIGYAMTSYAGGGNGSVSAVIMPDPKHLTLAGTAWLLGGTQGSTPHFADGQKFTIASATWAIVGSAALTVATNAHQGFGYGTTAGYAVGGASTGGVRLEAYKMPFSTETTAYQTSANLPFARNEASRGGMNSATHGYFPGGHTGSAVSNNVFKLTFSTDTMSAALGTNLAQARSFIGSVSNGTYGYCQGGYTSVDVVNSDKITFATDTVADNNAGDVSANRYATNSFAADNGYMASKSGATNHSHKIPFSTGVQATSNTLVSDSKLGIGVTDGSGLGWISGDDASTWDVSQKFTKATETYASDSGAVLAGGRYAAAQFNNGAY